MKSVDRARERGCETMQVFVSNPRGWKRSEVPPGDAGAFRARCEEAGIAPVFVHTIYLVNLASPDRETWERSVRSLEMDLRAAESIGADAVVTHPGSHGGEGVGRGTKRVARALDRALAGCGSGVRVLLENTSGAGNAMGGDLSRLGAILGECGGDARLGICLDTCHAFAYGYELRDPEGLEEALGALELEAGKERLMLVHANDGKGGRGSRLDRHEHIGRGELGMRAFVCMAAHPTLRGLPWIIETPGMDVEADRRNLELLRSLAGVDPRP